MMVLVLVLILVLVTVRNAPSLSLFDLDRGAADNDAGEEVAAGVKGRCGM